MTLKIIGWIVSVILPARTPRRRVSQNGQMSITSMFSPAPKKTTEEKKPKEENGMQDEDVVEPDEKKPKLEVDEEAKESTEDSNEK